MDKDRESAKNYAFLLLGYRSRTCFEIATKLRQKGYDSDTIRKVIEKLSEYNYLNDREFAKLWIRNRCRLKPMGKSRLRQELMAKGVEKDIIETELAELTDEEEFNLATQLVERKLAKKQYSRKQMASYLLRRGFSPSIMNKVTQDLTDFNCQNMGK